jgi:putative phosphoesterase
MKICIFSDVHGNMDALSNMISMEINSVDRFVFLGDIFGYFYDQKKIISQLNKLPHLYVVKGNHDNNYMECLKDGIFREKLVDEYGESYNYECDTDELDFIYKMSDYLEMVIDGKNMAFFHGGPDDFLNQRIYPDSEMNLCDYEEKFDYIFVGHTHYRMTRNFGRMQVINPGSLGQPRDDKGFSYCVFDTKTEEILFKSVHVDMHKLLSQVGEYDQNRKNGIYLLQKYGGCE